jgi:hypothetical protein
VKFNGSYFEFSTSGLKVMTMLDRDGAGRGDRLIAQFLDSFVAKFDIPINKITNKFNETHNS